MWIYKYVWQYLDFALSYRYSIHSCVGKVEEIDKERKEQRKKGKKEHLMKMVL